MSAFLADLQKKLEFDRKRMKAMKLVAKQYADMETKAKLRLAKDIDMDKILNGDGGQESLDELKKLMVLTGFNQSDLENNDDANLAIQ